MNDGQSVIDECAVDSSSSKYGKSLQYISCTRKMLVEYYDNEDHMLGSFSNKNLTSMKLRLKQRFIHSLVTKKKLIFGMIGSSVMAGHDNCHYDSYPSQFERMLKPIFDETEFDFEVRNAGIQGTCGDKWDHRHRCLQHLVGDADTIHGTWHYFGWHNNPDAMAEFIQWSLNGGAIPLTLHRWEGSKPQGGSIRLLGEWEQYGYNMLDYAYYSLKLNHVKFGWGTVGDGKHNVTRYGMSDDISDARRHSLGVNFRNWHPGPLTFQYVSDVLFYVYSDAIREALLFIEAQSAEDLTSVPDEPRIPGTRPNCIVGDDPVFGDTKIKVLKSEDVGERFKENGTWKRWYGGYENKIPGNEQEFEWCKHLDRCGGWKADSDHPENWLSFSIPKLVHGGLMFCYTANNLDRNKISTFITTKGKEFELQNWIHEEQVKGKYCRAPRAKDGNSGEFADELLEKLKQDDFHVHFRSSDLSFSIDEIISF